MSAYGQHGKPTAFVCSKPTRIHLRRSNIPATRSSTRCDQHSHDNQPHADALHRPSASEDASQPLALPGVHVSFHTDDSPDFAHYWAWEPADTVAAPSVVSPPPTVDPATAASPEAPAEPIDSTPEEVFYEGPGSNAELILSLVLLPTLFYAPLSIASIGRRLWIKFRFTNKRMSIINSSPLFSRTLEISYDKIKEIRSAPRGFGAWGDMVGLRAELSAALLVAWVLACCQGVLQRARPRDEPSHKPAPGQLTQTHSIKQLAVHAGKARLASLPTSAAASAHLCAQRCAYTSRCLVPWPLPQVVFLKDGSRIELTGLDKYKEIVEYINRQRYTIRS